MDCVSHAESHGRPEPRGVDRSRGWLLAATVMLYVGQPLVVSDVPADRGGSGVVVFAMLWLLLGLAWLLQAAVARRVGLRGGAVDLAVLLLVAWHTFSALVAVVLESPRPAMNVCWQWLALGIGFFLVRQLVVTTAESRTLMTAMIGLALGLSAIGYYQYFYSLPRDRARYEQIKDRPREMIQVVGEWYPPGSPERMLFESRLRAREPFATFALANSLAGYLAPWLVVALGLGLIGPCGRVGPGLGRWIRTAIIALPIGGCLLLTKSRSGLLAACLGAVLIGILGRRWGWSPRRATWIMAVGAMVGVVGGAIAVGGLDRQVFTEAGKSLGYRLQYWRSTLALVADHPWLGCGPGQFGDFYTGYKLPAASEEVRDPHNFLLEVWATAGTPALLALVAALALFARRVARICRTAVDGDPSAADRRRETTVGHIVVGAMAGPVLAWLVAPLAGLPLDGATWLIGTGGLGVGLLLGWTWTTAEDSRQDATLVARLAAVGTLVLLVNLLAAGGIGIPGVAGTLWLLMALGLHGAELHDRRSMVPRAPIWAAVGAATVMAVGCYVTAYRPVLASEAWMARANSPAGLQDAGKRTAWLRKAVAADPWSANAARALAAECFQHWRDAPCRATLEAFRQAAAHAARLAPRASVMWDELGRRWTTIYRATGVADALGEALYAHHRAITGYPNNARLRAHYALTLALAGQAEQARRQAARSRQLDRIARRAGHIDKCLDDALRRRLDKMVGQSQTSK